MAIKSEVSGSEGDLTATISITGRFDISTYNDFGESYKDKVGSVSKWIIDMTDVEYMDSSALGMLLMLRERGAPGDESNIRIVNCTPAVKKIFDMANFEKMFNIE